MQAFYYCYSTSVNDTISLFTKNTNISVFPQNKLHIKIRADSMIVGMGRYSVCRSNGTPNTMRPRQNGRHFPDDTFKRIFVNDNVRISIKISLKFVAKGPINKIPALVQIMAWRRPGDKPISEPRMESLLTDICVNELTKITAGCNNGFKKTLSNENLQHLTFFFIVRFLIGSGFVGSISQR